MTARPSLDQLRSDIEAAFAPTPYPGDDALVTGDVSYDPEYREVADAFRGKNWRQLSRAFIRRHQDALPLLTPAAFRYFLPAYLLACAVGDDDLDTAPLNVVSSLAPEGRAHPSTFTRAQAHAVVAFLELALAREEQDAPAAVTESVARRALRYWLRSS